MRTGKPIGLELSERLPVTATLLLWGGALAVLISLSVGLAGALSNGGFVDRTLRPLSLISASAPDFFVAALLVLLFSVVLASALFIGVMVGSFAAYVGGRVESVMVSVIDVFLCVPSLIVALAFIGILGPGYWSSVAALTTAWWANYTRISRAAVSSELAQPYIEAARVMGSGHLRIFTSHLLPHVLGLVLVYASADAGALVLAIATLSFLSLGVQPPVPEWGQMLVDGMSYLEEFPRLVIVPGAALTLVIISSNLLGEHFALRKVQKALSPRAFAGESPRAARRRRASWHRPPASERRDRSGGAVATDPRIRGPRDRSLHRDGQRAGGRRGVTPGSARPDSGDRRRERSGQDRPHPGGRSGSCPKESRSS